MIYFYCFAILTLFLLLFFILDFCVVFLCNFNPHNQGCQYRFDRCFVFSIVMECFSLGVFRCAILGLYCSYFYIYIYIYIYLTNIIQIQNKLIINYAI